MHACGSQNELSEPLHDYYTDRGSENRLSEVLMGVLQALAVVNTDFTHFYRPPTRFVIVKINSPNLYMHSTCFAVVKAGFPNIYTAHTRFSGFKTDSTNALW